MSNFDEVKERWESHEGWQFADRDAERKYFFEAGAASRDAEIAELKLQLSGKTMYDAVAVTAQRCAEIIENASNCDEHITYEQLADAIRKEFNL